MQSVKQRRDAARLIPRIDAIGFTSVMLMVLFVLMLIFMITPPNHHAIGHDVNMVKVRHPASVPDADRDDAIVIVISRDGKFYFGNDAIEAKWLQTKIREWINYGAPRIVYLKVDARARYRYVKDALDGVHASGLEKIVFLVEKQRSQQ